MDTTSSAYRLLSLIALSGECCIDVLSYMGISKSYGEKLITKLKEENYIKTHYKDRLRGYRLTSRGKSFCYRTTLSGSPFIYPAIPIPTVREAIIPED